MTETESRPVSRRNYSEGISIETSKVVQGMSLVFSGALTMLEAIHPKISLDPAELMCLITGDKDGLARLSEMKKAENAEKTTQTEKPKEETHETENAGDGTVDVPADDPDAAVSDTPVDNHTADRVKREEPKPVEEQKSAKPATMLTQDDITKVIVQKIKANRSNNEKIGQLLKTYGAARVSDLPASKYDSFITDLAAI